MLVLGKPLADLTAEDIRLGLVGQMMESKTSEFKRELPGDTDSDVKEFLADISSFANAEGGTVFYGIAESQGKAIDAPGIECDDPDKLILKVEQRIGSGVEPRIPGILTKAVELAPGHYVLVVTVPPSWARPHRVKKGLRFCSRNSAGKYELSVPEIGDLFLANASARSRIVDFRSDRLAKIVACDGPVMLDKEFPKVVVHVVPVQLKATPVSSDFLEIWSTMPCPLDTSSYDVARNFDGAYSYAVRQDGDHITSSYTQVFRNGAVELVGCGLVRPHGDKRQICITTFEPRVVAGVGNALAAQHALGVEPPFIVMLSLLQVKGFEIGPLDPMKHPDVKPIDRHDLILPEILLENVGEDISASLAPTFGLLWNACNTVR